MSPHGDRRRPIDHHNRAARPPEAADKPVRSQRRPPAPLQDIFDDDDILPRFADTRAIRQPAEPRSQLPRTPDQATLRPDPGQPAGARPAPEPARSATAGPSRAQGGSRPHAARGLDYRGIDAQLDRVLHGRPPLRAPTVPLPLRGPLLLGMIAVVSVMILLTAAGNGSVVIGDPRQWSPFGTGGGAGVNAIQESIANARPPGDYALKAPPSLAPAQIDHILAEYRSPASGTGQIWYDLGRRYEIDPAFAVAFFIHESAAGTSPAWAGLKPDGSTTHNVGNIICAGYSRCYGRFRDYQSWEEGIEDWYRLIEVEYLQGRGHRTVADIIPVYAPSIENDVQHYIHVVQQLVDEWRANGVR